MKKYLVFLFFLFTFFTIQAQIDYKLSMSNPKSHYFEVEMNIKNIKENSFEVKMPVWAPGSYLVRDFSKSVDRVYAYDEKMNPLPIYKVTKNAWKVENGKSKNVIILYKVFAFEQSVRTSYLDEFHGFVSGTGVFMYVEQFRNQKGNLTVIPYSTFSKISTGLEESGEGVVEDNKTTDFVFKDYDQLVDCPLEIGNQTTFEFTASGCKHIVAMYGDANYNIDILKRDMAKVVEAATSVFGENPNKRYVFIVHNETDAQGGLEHCNSTTLSVNASVYYPENYTKFLTLVAHEYFHLWNVKRLRAKALGPFDYDQENYTPLLYVMEGFTSYYEDLIVHKAGFTSEDEFLHSIQGGANYAQAGVGARVQSLTESSFDAWIKAYKPTVNSANTTISYYSGGGVIAALMDAMIISKTKGEKTLDDFMKLLYEKYYKAQNIGFTEEEFENDFSEFMDDDMDNFFKFYVRGTKIPLFKSVLGRIGITVEEIQLSNANTGISITDNGIVRSVRSNSAGEKAGISPFDKILSINGQVVSGKEAQDKLDSLKVGEKVDIQYVRDGVHTCTLINENFERPSFKFSLPADWKSSTMLKAFFRVN